MKRVVVAGAIGPANVGACVKALHFVDHQIAYVGLLETHELMRIHGLMRTHELMGTNRFNRDT